MFPQCQGDTHHRGNTCSLSQDVGWLAHPPIRACGEPCPDSGAIAALRSPPAPLCVLLRPFSLVRVHAGSRPLKGPVRATNYVPCQLLFARIYLKEHFPFTMLVRCS